MLQGNFIVNLLYLQVLHINKGFVLYSPQILKKVLFKRNSTIDVSLNVPKNISKMLAEET